MVTIKLAPGVLAAPSANPSSTPVGTIVASSPLLPTPLKGKIFLTGTLSKLRLLFKFPAPAALTLTGLGDTFQNSVTISVIPDVPLTRQQVTFPGGRAGLLFVSCPKRPASLRGKFTAQSGSKTTSTHRLRVTGCKG
jgi:hypothetical protein